ncbi:TRAP transporter substrate-binding protein [Parvularcula marina]|uniref:TRAP transporter substrate-binding protein n=1 Tax=Parvularcula marina TaxID=2292771 RepID=UPI0018F44243|nr:TRAP transporter substrate-binding protein [Parvularcula marina]
MTLSRRQFTQAAIAGLGAAGLSSCAKAERPLFAADAQPADYPTVKALEFIAKRLEEETAGRLAMRIYAGAQLGRERDTLEITVFGGLDVNRVNTAPLNPIAEETLVPALPFVFRSIDHMRAAVDGAPGQKILDALRPKGLVGLCYYDSGARSFYNAKRPVLTPDDLGGMKIRVQNSDLYVSMVEALGANATPMSFAEVYQGLIQGVIDGAENNWPSYETTRHFEAAPYYSRTEHIMAPEVLVMSLRRWEKLSEDDQELFRRIARESVPVMRDIWDARVEKSKEIVMAGGIELVDPVDKAPFQEKMQPVYDRFVSSKLRPLVEEIQAMEVPGV